MDGFPDPYDPDGDISRFLDDAALIPTLNPPPPPPPPPGPRYHPAYDNLIPTTNPNPPPPPQPPPLLPLPPPLSGRRPVSTGAGLSGRYYPNFSSVAPNLGMPPLLQLPRPLGGGGRRFIGPTSQHPEFNANPMSNPNPPAPLLLPLLTPPRLSAGRRNMGSTSGGGGAASAAQHPGSISLIPDPQPPAPRPQQAVPPPPPGSGPNVGSSSGGGESSRPPEKEKELSPPAFVLLAPGKVLDCSFCTVTDRLDHYANGLKCLEVSVHARMAHFDHIVFQVKHIDRTGRKEIYYADVKGQGIVRVKSFLLEYNIRMIEYGIIEVSSESLVSMYVRLQREAKPEPESREPSPMADQPPAIDSDEGGPSSPPDSATGSSPDSPTESDSEILSSRAETPETRYMASQITLERLASKFSYPVNDAIKELGICHATLKELLRKYNIPRWPHRQIYCVERKILRLHRNLEGKIRDNDQSGAASVRTEIGALMEKRAQLYMGFPPADLSLKR